LVWQTKKGECAFLEGPDDNELYWLKKKRFITENKALKAGTDTPKQKRRKGRWFTIEVFIMKEVSVLSWGGEHRVLRVSGMGSERSSLT